MTIVEALGALVEGRDLSEEEAATVMRAIMEGQGTPAQIGALLAVLRAKHETAEELTGLARAMREKSVRVYPNRRPLIDTCGTGGDVLKTFNVSTTAAFVVAAGGVAVAKHGNRAATSKCGSADVLEALGVRLAIPPAQVARCIDEVGIGFLFAPQHHPAMLYAAQPRKELGFRTVFNVLGPLTNPAGATHQLIGVYHPDLALLLARALARLGCERAMVVHGMDGIDEVSTIGATRICTVLNGAVDTETKVPEDFGLCRAETVDLAGAQTPAGNAEMLLDVLSGAPGPRRDIVLLNSAAGLILGGAACSWADGLRAAAELIDTGRARRVLDELVRFTAECDRQ
ncbi:MAG: anthranilate phosphoribosyltransferase [Chthonomonadales bacterium]|nr:anthranilate phosphoribosyltransferase [Chthonomonadales bacterium]